MSQFADLLPKSQQLALSFWYWIAILLFIGGIIAPIFFGWLWLGLLILSIVVWQANSQSLYQFFLANLASNKAFYEAARATPVGDKVRVVFKS